MQRTIEDVTAMLLHANQKEDNINPLTQIFYHPTEAECVEAKENWKLMELEEELVEKLEEGERLIFKGCGAENIVLCTSDETFEVKEGEVSNSLVVCPDLVYYSDAESINSSERILRKQMVLGIYNCYFELRLTFPRLNKLRSFLACTVYKGPSEEENTHHGYYLHELLDNIQCSRKELTDHLKKINAICINNKWRLLNLEYETRALSFLISLMEEKKWTEIPGDETKTILKPVLPEFIISHVLEFYATPTENDANLHTLKEDKVSRCFAEMLLKTAEGKFRYSEFMMAWEQCLPPGTKPDLEHLKGLALVEKEGMHQEVIHLYPEYNLPENLSERFRLLFKRKEKWTLDEITPYIEKLATKSMNVSTMLTKYARASSEKGVRVFGAKYAK